MQNRQRWFIAGVLGVALIGVVGVVTHFFGIKLAGVLVAVLGSLVGLLRSLFKWARHSATVADTETLDTTIRDEALKRSVGALPDLVSRQGMLDLGVEPRLRLVHDPSKLTTAVEVRDVGSAFDAAHRRLLIVGEPASGKTIAAYRLVSVVAGDETFKRVPLLVNLSAWADQYSFEEFLVDYLCARGDGYGVINRNAAKVWVARRHFWLVLDGLDEAPAEWRASLLSRLEEWLPVGMPVVLTCRTREYDELIHDRARGISLAMAVELQPLDDSQLDSALVEMARRVDGSWSDFVGRWKSGQRQAVREALRRPLVLNLAVSSGITPAELRDAGKEGTEAVAAFIIDEYLASTLQSDPSLRSWVRWIARYLTGMQRGPFGVGSNDETVFDLGRVTPTRIPRRYAAAVLLPLSLLLLGMAVPLIQPSAQSVLFWLLATVSAVALAPEVTSATSQTFRVQDYWLKWPRVALVPMSAMLSGLAVSAVLAVAFLFADHESRNELLLVQLIGLQASVNQALADTPPGSSPEEYASELESLVAQVREREDRAPSEADAATLNEMMRSFEATTSRFRAAQEEAVASEYGMPPLDSDPALQNEASRRTSMPVQKARHAAEDDPSPVVGTVAIDLDRWLPTPFVFVYPFGIMVGLLFSLWMLIRPRHYEVGNSLDGPWRQSRRSALSTAILLLVVCGLPFALRFGLKTGAAVALVMGMYGGLTSGGWFLFLQRLAWRGLHREYGLDPHPLSVLRRGAELRAGVLPLLRQVGTGVRFIHNDVRDRLSYGSIDDTG